MTSPAKPVFGKRSAARPRVVAPAVPRDNEHAAFFAAMRDAMVETETIVPMAVPRSFKAAFLAGLVVGCALAGFTMTAGGEALGPLSSLPALGVNTQAVLPALLLVALVGGARAAATTILVVHAVLAKARQTGPVAYATGGALASGVVAGVMMIALHHAPAHGWPVEIAEGAGSGFLYRIFAGSKPAIRQAFKPSEATRASTDRALISRRRRTRCEYWSGARGRKADRD